MIVLDSDLEASFAIWHSQIQHITMASFDETGSDDDVFTPEVLCTAIISPSLTAECHTNRDGITSIKLIQREGRGTRQLTLLRTDWQRLLCIAIPADHVVESKTAGILILRVIFCGFL